MGIKKRWYAASIVGIYNEHYDVGWWRHLLSPQITLFNDNCIQNKFRGTDKAKTSEFLTHLFYSHPSTYQNGLVQTKGYPFLIVMICFFWWRKSLWSMGTWVPCGQADVFTSCSKGTMSSWEILQKLFGSVWDSHISHSGMIHNISRYLVIINQDGFFTANSCYQS